MIRAFQLPGYSQHKITSPADVDGLDKAVWIDLQNPVRDEIRAVEKKFAMAFPTRQQQEEIETSSRYLEENNEVKINTTFLALAPGSDKPEKHDISFILRNDMLFSLRFCDSKVFSEVVKRIKYQPGIFNQPSKILVAILETNIDYDADTIEGITQNINDISRKINYSGVMDKQNIIRVNAYQDLMITVRESLFDKQRLVSALIRNESINHENSDKLRIMIKDISSLIDHTAFNFTRLEYIQNTILGLINLDQNQIIKIFTVASVIFMPPTLIASIYGMNFKLMPELQWMAGYPFALCLMLLSSLTTLWIFKRKKWL